MNPKLKVTGDDDARFSRHDMRWSFQKGVWCGVGAAGAVAGFVLLVIQTLLAWR